MGAPRAADGNQQMLLRGTASVSFLDKFLARGRIIGLGDKFRFFGLLMLLVSRSLCVG